MEPVLKPKDRLAADQGHASAQFNLGISYDNGQGVPQNYAEAVKWYRLAADQGDASAQYNLGQMYRLGEGVPQDYVSAHMWLNQSAAKGETRAAKLRDGIAAKMTPYANSRSAEARTRVEAD
jgi:TPR repeat protein